MDTFAEILKALTPVIVGAFAIQGVLEIVGSTLTGDTEKQKLTKKRILGFLGLILGLIFAFWADLRVVNLLGFSIDQVADRLMTGLAIGSMIDGSNSILKLLQYWKENVKDGDDNDGDDADDE